MPTPLELDRFREVDWGGPAQGILDRFLYGITIPEPVWDPHSSTFSDLESRMTNNEEEILDIPSKLN